MMDVASRLSLLVWQLFFLFHTQRPFVCEKALGRTAVLVFTTEILLQSYMVLTWAQMIGVSFFQDAFLHSTQCSWLVSTAEANILFL